MVYNKPIGIMVLLLLITVNIFPGISGTVINRREILPPYKYKIILPDLNYTYFLHGDEYKFESNREDYSPINAWWLSEISFITYAPPGFTRATLRKAGFSDVEFFQNGSSEGLITWNDEIVVISFRGTEMNSIKIVTDVMTDVNTLPTNFEKGGRVHKGFLYAFKSIWNGKDGMNAFLNQLLEDNNNRSIWLTGHSLGAAIATICFTYLEDAAGLYTIGSPRVGDKAFTELTKERPIFRLVNNKDPFALTPPSIPAYNFYFADNGSLIFLDSYGLIHNNINNESYVANDDNLGNKILGSGEINMDFIKNMQIYSSYIYERYNVKNLNIFDHMPIYYSLKLWNNMVETR